MGLSLSQMGVRSEIGTLPGLNTPFKFPSVGEKFPVTAKDSVGILSFFSPLGRAERKETARWAVLAKSLFAAVVAKRQRGINSSNDNSC